jgi:hypothetical protein
LLEEANNGLERGHGDGIEITTNISYFLVVEKRREIHSYKLYMRARLSLRINTIIYIFRTSRRHNISHSCS